MCDAILFIINCSIFSLYCLIFNIFLRVVYFVLVLL